MNIYDFGAENDPLASAVFYVGLNVPSNEIKTSNEKFDVSINIQKGDDKSSYYGINMSQEELLSNVLAWGCIEPKSSITFTKTSAFSGNKLKTRKVDLNKKTQWLS